MVNNIIRQILVKLFILTGNSEPIFLSTAKAGNSSSSSGLGLMAYIETGEHSKKRK